MKRISFTLLCLVATLNIMAQALIPYPQKITWEKGTTSTSSIVFTPLLNMTAHGPATPPGWYAIRVQKDGIRVSFTDEQSRLYAQATLRQLEVRPGVYRCCSIEDWPRFEWRGAMIDVSRHFFSAEQLMKNIDVLSSYKINRLHLHLVDAAGWRMEIERYPRLTQQAAYRTKESWNEWWLGHDRGYVETQTGVQDSLHYGGFFSKPVLKNLVAYAQEKGITIVPEIEMPGHSEEVLHAYPELSCTHKEGAADFCPGNVGTYDFLEHVLEEVMEVFPSEYIHVGGDEAGRADWPSCPRCQQKLKEIGGTDYRDLQTYLIAHMGRFLEKHGRKLVGWDEVIDPGLHEGSTIMVWRGEEKAAEAARLGLDVVMTPGAYCYFDSYQDAPPSQPEGFGTYLPLEKVYSFNPLARLTPEQAKQVKGVQGNLWTEYVPTPEHQEYMLYPRILALAEVGWGTANRTDFRQRALEHTDKLRKNGVNAFNLRTEVGERRGVTTPAKHKAVGAKVTYNTRYADNYCGQGDGTLVDGYSGGWAFGDGRWQGFLCKEGKQTSVFDVIIDLGRPQSIHEVTAPFMQSCSAWIAYPELFRVSVSNDLNHWTIVGEQHHPYAATAIPDVLNYSVKCRATARYIRVEADVNEAGQWLFTDEISVR